MEIQCAMPDCSVLLTVADTYKPPIPDFTDVFKIGALCEQHFKGVIVQVEPWILNQYKEVLLEARSAPALILYEALQHQQQDSLRWRVIAHAILEDAMLIEETMLMLCQGIRDYEQDRVRLLKKGKDPNGRDNPAIPLFFWLVKEMNIDRGVAETLVADLTNTDAFIRSLGFSLTDEMRANLSQTRLREVELAIERIHVALRVAANNRHVKDRTRIHGDWPASIHPPHNMLVDVVDKMRHGYVAINLPEGLQFYDTQVVREGHKTRKGYLMTPKRWAITDLTQTPNHLRNQSEACFHLINLYLAFRYGDLASYQAKHS